MATLKHAQSYIPTDPTISSTFWSRAVVALAVCHPSTLGGRALGCWGGR
jgi:hypothetical protein